jgi:YVTN family beta-propeller protein
VQTEVQRAVRIVLLSVLPVVLLLGALGPLIPPQGSSLNPTRQPSFPTTEPIPVASIARVPAVSEQTVGHRIGDVRVGLYPSGIVYDPRNGDLYVTNYGDGTVSVLSTAPLRVVATITMGLNPWKLAFDPSTNRIFVGSDFSDLVTIIDATTNTVSGHINVGCGFTVGVLFDSLNGLLYVECDETSTVAVVNPVTHHVLKQIATGPGEANGGEAVNPATGDIYFANYFGNTITIVSGANNSVVAQVTVGNQPTATLYNPLRNQIDVLVGGFEVSPEHQLLVLNPKDNTAAGRLYVGVNPITEAFDGKNQLIVVADADAGRITVVDARSDKVLGHLSVGIYPDDIAFNPSNGVAYVGNGGGDTVMAFWLNA